MSREIAVFEESNIKGSVGPFGPVLTMGDVELTIGEPELDAAIRTVSRIRAELDVILVELHERKLGKRVTS